MLRHSMSGVLACALVVHAGVTLAADASKDVASNKIPTVAIGSQVSDATFKDIRFTAHNLKDFGDKKAYVVVFTTLDCPVVKRYLPRVVEIEKEFRDRGVQFVAMNVGPNDPMVEVAYQAIQVDAPFPFCKDFDGDVVKAMGVNRTPEVVVLDGERKLRYRGRIDSQFRAGGVKPDAGRNDLKEAIEDVLAGRDVKVAETPVEGCLITLPNLSAPLKPVTYAEHIATIMQKHCQECHRPNAEGPFSLLTYEDAVDHAEMVGETVKEQRMPPLYASKEHGDFTNLRSLTNEERTLVRQWISGGMQQGDMSKAPANPKFRENKWCFEPDLVLKMPKRVELPATGYVKYQYVILNHTFKEDTWITAAQILPENKTALHHCNLACIDPVSALSGKFNAAKFITGQVPGGEPMNLENGVAFMIPKGAVLVMQIHYVTTGEKTSDQSSVGLRFAKYDVQKELKHFQCHNGTFAIPPGDSAHLVGAKRKFANDATLYGMFSHMHLRGKDMMFDAIYPDGNRERLLAIPNYDFNWQMQYVSRPGAKKFPKGTVLDCTAHFDNSSFNPYNPDPKETVREGQQTYQEMMYGFVFYTEDHENLNLKIDPNTGHVIKPAEGASVKPAGGNNAGG